MNTEKVLGIIVEYNPLHKGHLYHLNMAKQLVNPKYTVALMSGNFTQRGLPAVLDKFTRTSLALYYGVDMVVELPVIYAMGAAQYFAFGSINILNSLPVTHLCFGAEEENLSKLWKCAEILAHEPPEFKSVLKQGLKEGLSYPKAREFALKAVNSSVRLLPNNILAVEYLKALIQTSSSIIPINIKRDSKFLSATCINQNLRKGNYKILEELPDLTAEALVKNKDSAVNLDNYSSIFHYKLLSNDLEKYLDIKEGLDNRLRKAATEFFNISQIITGTKTKRYTQTRLQRIILQILLDITKEDMDRWRSPPYVRVLGLKKEAASLLKNVDNLVMNIKKARLIEGRELLEKEISATDIYYLGQNRGGKGYEYKEAIRTNP